MENGETDLSVSKVFKGLPIEGNVNLCFTLTSKYVCGNCHKSNIIWQLN